MIEAEDYRTVIPADARDRIFEPFLTTKPSGEGTGLGPSIAYSAIHEDYGDPRGPRRHGRDRGR